MVASSQPVIWLIAVAGVLVPAPVAGSITLRVSGMMEPSERSDRRRDGNVDVVDAV